MANDIESRFRTVYDQLIDSMPDPPAFERLEGDRSRVTNRQTRSGLIVALGSALTVFAVVGVAAMISTPEDAAGPVVVDHQIAQYQLDMTVACEGGAIEQTGRFDSYTIETWTDDAGGRSRTLVTYPDGSTFEVVRDGNVRGKVYARGEQQGIGVTCNVGDGSIVVATSQDQPFAFLAHGPLSGLVTESGTFNFASVNVTEDSPELAQLGTLCDVLGSPEEWLFGSDEVILSSEDQHCTGSLNGRPTHVGLFTNLGIYYLSTSDERTARQSNLVIHEYESERLIQDLRRISVERVAETTESLTVTDRSEVTVDSRIFSTAGMTPLSGEVTVD